MAKNGRMFSPWVLVGVAVVAVVLLGVGGGLIGAFEACIVDPYTTFCNYVRAPLYDVRSRTMTPILIYRCRPGDFLLILCTRRIPLKTYG